MQSIISFIKEADAVPAIDKINDCRIGVWLSDKEKLQLQETVARLSTFSKKKFTVNAFLRLMIKYSCKTVTKEISTKQQKSY